MRRLSSVGVSLAILVSEGCWLYLIAGLLGAMAGNQGSVVSFLGVLLLLLAASNLSRLLSTQPITEKRSMIAGAATSLLLIYGVLAVQYGLTWPGLFIGENENPFAATRMGMACLMSLLIWWRGTRIGNITDSESSLRMGFRLGLFILCISAVIEVGYKIQLHVGSVAFPFFATSLSGLALLTLGQEESQSKWHRVLVGFIGGVLAFGALSTLAVGSVLTGVAQGIFKLLGLAAFYLSYAVFFVLEHIIRGIFWAIFALRKLFGNNTPFEFKFSEFLKPVSREASTREVSSASAIAAVIIKWALLVLIIVGIILFLAWLFRRNARKGLDTNEERESLRDEAEKENQGSLLGVLIPRLRPRERPEPYALLEGTDPKTRLARLYFRALNAAMQKGQVRTPSETPREFAPKLAVALPGSDADGLSQSFAAMRYGDVTPAPDTVATLEGSVTKSLSSGG